jgi:hypothetical protein
MFLNVGLLMNEAEKKPTKPPAANFFIKTEPQKRESDNKVFLLLWRKLWGKVSMTRETTNGLKLKAFLGFAADIFSRSRLK